MERASKARIEQLLEDRLINEIKLQLKSDLSMLVIEHGRGTE